MTWCIQFPWYLLWPHNSKLRVTIRREREGTNRKPLKCNPTHAGHGPALSFWKKQFLKQSYPLRGTAGGGTTSRERGKAAEPVMENPQSLSSPLITLTKIKLIWWNTAQLHPTLLRNWIWLLKSAPKPLLSKYWRFTSVNCIQTTPGQERMGETRQDGSSHVWFIFRAALVSKSSLVSFVTCQGSNTASLAVS